MKSFAFATLVALTLQTMQASAQTNWPDRNLKLIVPFAAGSTVDNVARIVAEPLAVRLGKPVIIENRTGASGTIGLAALAASAPDGYTFGMGTTSNVAVAVGAYPKLPYSPIRDFVSIGMAGSSPYLLVVNAKLPIHSVQDLVALAKKRPGELKYGSIGQTSLANLSTLLLANSMGIKLTHVPYRSAGQVSIDALAGIIDMQFSTLGATLPFTESAAPVNRDKKDQMGRLRVLGVSSARRVPELPDTPTIEEAGVPGYDSVLWIAMFAPARTPTAIVARMNVELNAVLKEVQVAKALAEQGVAVDMVSPEQLTVRVDSEIKKWSRVVKEAGITEH